MAASSIAKIVPRILWILGGQDGTFSTTVSDDRFVLEEIQRAVVETEAHLVRVLCESHHPARVQFLGWTTDLANGVVLPVHIGQVEAVQIKPYSGASSYQIGEATSRENIRDWRENCNKVFDSKNHDVNGSSLTGYFNLTDEILTFTGNVAQASICTYAPDYATPSLVIDNSFDGALVAGAIPRLFKVGVPGALIQSYTSLYASILEALRQGLQTNPNYLGVQSAPGLPAIQAAE